MEIRVFSCGGVPGIWRPTAWRGSESRGKPVAAVSAIKAIARPRAGKGSTGRLAREATRGERRDVLNLSCHPDAFLLFSLCFFVQTTTDGDARFHASTTGDATSHFDALRRPPRSALERQDSTLSKRFDDALFHDAVRGAPPLSQIPKSNSRMAGRQDGRTAGRQDGRTGRSGKRPGHCKENPVHTHMHVYTEQPKQTFAYA